MEISTFHSILKAKIKKMGSLKNTIETHHFGTGEIYKTIILSPKSETFDLLVIPTLVEAEYLLN